MLGLLRLNLGDTVNRIKDKEEKGRMYLLSLIQPSLWLPRCLKSLRGDPLFTQSLNKYTLNAYYVSGTILGTEDTRCKKKTPVSLAVCFSPAGSRYPGKDTVEAELDLTRAAV